MEKPQDAIESVPTEKHQSLAEFPEFVTVQEAEPVLRLDGDTIRRLCQKKVLPSVKIGGVWRLYRKELLDFVNSGKSATDLTNGAAQDVE